MITKIDRGLISGIRVYIDIEDLKNFNLSYREFRFNEMPPFVQNGTWFQLNGLDVEILKKDDNSFDMRPMKYVGNAKGEITNIRVSKEMLKNAYCTLSEDDQIKIFLYNNKPYLWNYLVNEFKNEENIYNYYLRFNH